MSQPSGLILRGNDRVVFLGDSITEQQLYTNYVESYLATRYPELGLTFFNAGWGGDSSTGGAKRLERDVLSLRPTVVTICYGMNDGCYTLPTDEIRATFVGGMRELIARLKAADVRTVLLTPGMVDETVSPQLASVRYNHQGLRVIADEVLKLAVEHGLPSFDLHRLMNEVDQRAKAAVPGFCMIPDSVHPDPAGHLVMAFGLLHALGVPPRRLEIDMDIETGRAKASDGVSVGRIRKNAYGFTLDMRLERLPFFIEPAARKVLPFLPFLETFNELKMILRGLKNARALFRSETMRSASITSGEFAKGVNLFSQWVHPAVRQAEKVHRYTLDKDLVYFKIWRALSLNNENTAFHNARAHTAGIRMMPILDRGRDRLLKGRPVLASRLSFVYIDLPGEPLVDGDFITQWSLRGPHAKPWNDDKLGGEAAFSAREPSLTSEWLAADLDLSSIGNNLIQVFGQKTDCFAYAVTLIQSPVEQTAELLIGSDDGVAVWLNGVRIWNNLDVGRSVTIDQDRMPAALRQGVNILLMKISQGPGGWGFCARFAGLRRSVATLRPQDHHG